MTPDQLLAVLKSGATVEWEQYEFKLVPDLLRGNIDTYEGGQYAGLWALNMDGARASIHELNQKIEDSKT